MLTPRVAQPSRPQRTARAPRADRDFDVDHPDVVAAREAMEAAADEAESARKGQKASTNYHLSRYLRR